MRNSILVHVDGKTYMQRIKSTLIGPLLFAIFVITIGYLGTESPWTLLAGILLFSWYKMKADREQYLMFTDEQKGFTLRQFALGDWEENMINQLIEELEPNTSHSELAAAS